MNEVAGGWWYCLTFLLLCAAIWRWSRRLPSTVRKLVRLFLLGWIGSASVLLVRLIEYNVILSFRSFLYLSVFVTLFVAGLIISSHGEKNMPLDPESTKPIKSHTVVFLLVLSLGYIVLVGIDVLSRAPQILDGFALLRAIQWENFETGREITAYGSLVAVSRAAAFIFCCLILGVSKPRKLHKVLAILFLVIIVLELLLAAGRSVMFYLLFTIVFIRISFGNSDVIRDYKAALSQKVKKYGYIALGGVTVFYMLIIFPTLRNSDRYTDYDLYLGFRHDSHLSEWVNVTNEYIPGFSTLAFGSDYLSQPIVKMTDFIEKIGVNEWYAMGSYSFSVPAKIYSMFGGGNVHHNIRMQLESAVASQGYLGIRPWSTSAGDFSVDFGLLGGCVAALIVGWVLGRLYFLGLRLHSPEGMILCGLVALSLAIFPFKSPLNITIIANSLVLALAVYVLGRWKIRVR